MLPYTDPRQVIEELRLVPHPVLTAMLLALWLWLQESLSIGHIALGAQRVFGPSPFGAAVSTTEWSFRSRQPSTFAGLKWRWKAMMTRVVTSSSSPVCGQA